MSRVFFTCSAVVALTISATSVFAATPPKPFKGLFFDNDFSYKSKADAPYILGEELKDVTLFEMADSEFVFSTGGEIRNRYHDERNRLVPGGPGLNSYNQYRWRQYLNMKAGDRFRVYVEGIDASTFGEELPEVAIDVNRWDLQNAFVDINLFEVDNSPVWFRYGRQELLYGAQRLISPLDFATTRRNFEGAKLFTKVGDWKIDAFSVRPVNAAAGNGPLSRLDNSFDNPDQSALFSSVYTTYTGMKDNTFDFYWIWLKEDDERVRPPRFPDGNRQTIGARWAGKNGNVSWDIEGGYQYGDDEFGENVKAGFATGIIGYQFADMPWKPKISGVYWWGSGDDDPTDRENNTFTTYFPLGHAYWGVIDNLGGPNLQDVGILASFAPHKKVNVTLGYHWFHLANGNDVLYNVAQVPLGAPGNGTEIGQEFDVIVNFNYNQNISFQMQYAEFFYGDYVDNTLPRDDARQFFIQSALKY